MDQILFYIFLTTVRSKFKARGLSGAGMNHWDLLPARVKRCSWLLWICKLCNLKKKMSGCSFRNDNLHFSIVHSVRNDFNNVVSWKHGCEFGFECCGREGVGHVDMWPKTSLLAWIRSLIVVTNQIGGARCKMVSNASIFGSALKISCHSSFLLRIANGRYLLWPAVFFFLVTSLFSFRLQKLVREMSVSIFLLKRVWGTCSLPSLPPKCCHRLWYIPCDCIVNHTSSQAPLFNLYYNLFVKN